MTALSLQPARRLVAELSAADRTAMHALMTAHYEAVPRERFEADLAWKDEVLLVLDDAGAIRGFTTLAWNPGGALEDGDVLFSGDTIIDRRCWGTQELVKAFCRRAGEWRAQRERPLFWFLMSKGHRTFLYLPLFARRFHPHPAQDEPAWRTLAAKVAAQLFGAAWQPAAGVVRHPQSHGHLAADLADTTLERSQDPWVRFFLERNPGFARGDELVCLTELEPGNLRRTARNAFLAGMAGAS